MTKEETSRTAQGAGAAEETLHNAESADVKAKTEPVTALWAVGSDAGDGTRLIDEDFFPAFAIKPAEQLTPEFQIQLPDGTLIKCNWDGQCAEVVDDKLTLNHGCCYMLVGVSSIVIAGKSYPCVTGKSEGEKYRLTDLISLECYVGESLNGIRLMNKVLAKYPDAMKYNPYAYYRRAEAFLVEGIYPEAIANFTYAIKAADETGSENWRYYFDRATAKYRLNNVEGFKEDIAECCRQGYTDEAKYLAKWEVPELYEVIKAAMFEIGAIDSVEENPESDKRGPIIGFSRGFPVVISYPEDISMVIEK